VKKIGILYHPKVEAAQVTSSALESGLERDGLRVWACSAWAPDEVASLLPGTDLVVTVGGDGTILRGVQAVVEAGVPVIGVNLGKLGFMTELTVPEALDKLRTVIAGEGWLDERAMLEATLVSGSAAPRTFQALNDIVVARGGIARIIRVAAAVDGTPCAVFKADAVIVATATGSTGYSLAAGGPIVYPWSADFLLTPVAPHLGPGFPLVLSGESTVFLRVETYLEATLSIDGHINETLADGDTITIRRSPRVARFLRLKPREAFFATLETRLKGNTR
jgi:NAD+ kinase